MRVQDCCGACLLQGEEQHEQGLKGLVKGYEKKSVLSEFPHISLYPESFQVLCFSGDKRVRTVL